MHVWEGKTGVIAGECDLNLSGFVREIEKIFVFEISGFDSFVKLPKFRGPRRWGQFFQVSIVV